MSEIAGSLFELRARRSQYIACETAIVGGAQQYEVENKMFRKAELSIVRKMIKELGDAIAAKNPRVKRMRVQSMRIGRP